MLWWYGILDDAVETVQKYILYDISDEEGALVLGSGQT